MKKKGHTLKQVGHGEFSLVPSVCKTKLTNNGTPTKINNNGAALKSKIPMDDDTSADVIESSYDNEATDDESSKDVNGSDQDEESNQANQDHPSVSLQWAKGMSLLCHHLLLY